MHSFDAAAVRPVGAWHLTLGVMSLPHPEQLASAVKLLDDLDVVSMLAQEAGLGTTDGSAGSMPPVGTMEQPVLDSGASAHDTTPCPLVISLTSLAPMHEEHNTSILYAIPADVTNRLQPFCQRIRDAFSTAGLLVPDDRPLRLHATVVNTVYAQVRTSRERRGGHGPKSPGTRRFDARGILVECKGWKWTDEFRVEKIAICEMGAKKIMDDDSVVDERYTEVAAAKMP